MVVDDVEPRSVLHLEKHRDTLVAERRDGDHAPVARVVPEPARMVSALLGPQLESGQAFVVADDMRSSAVNQDGREGRAVIVPTDRMRNRSSHVAGRMTVLPCHSTLRSPSHRPPPEHVHFLCWLHEHLSRFTMRECEPAHILLRLFVEESVQQSVAIRGG